MRSQPIRFTGMASGMDTDSIVKDLMRPQQYKIDKEKKAQALVKLKQDAWKDMNKSLYEFHTKFTDKMRQTSTFNKKIVTSSDESAISITNGEMVPEGTHTFEVTQLAESARVVGQIKDGETFKVTEETTLKMKVNDTYIEVKVKVGDGLSEIAQAMNERFKDAGKDEKGNTIDTGFTASYDAKNGSFFVSSKATGADQKIHFGVDKDGKDVASVELFEKMGLSTDKETTGENAIYSYNGAKGLESASNKIVVNGIEATLKAKTTQPVNISAEADADAIYDFVKEFVTEYNNLIDEINLKIGTKPGKDISPLTAEERDSMSESEIKLWEDKLNSSLFYKDPQLTSFVDSARSILGAVLGMEDGSSKSLASLGIITGSWEEKGKLHIIGDEDDALYSDQPNKLKEAIAKDSKGVTEFFTKLGKNLYEDHNKTLTASNKLKSAMNFYNDKVMNDKVETLDKRILTLEERMYRMEKMQYAKFATMEKMLSSLNNQSSWLSQQFGG